MRTKKRTYFLIEILIGLGLAAAMLTVLFQFLISNARFELGIERAQATLREQQRVQEKINSLFLSLRTGGKEPPLYTAQYPDEKSISLIAHFDAGIDPDPLYSGLNKGRLYIDEENRFRFTQMPIEAKGNRSEILLEDVRAIEWEFLGHLYEKDTAATPISGTWAWMSKWSKTAHAPPSIIRLYLWHGIDKKKQREPNLQIAFILPRQDPIRIIKNL